jgi:hypothetical protein
MKFFEMTVTLYVEAESSDEAFSIVENEIDDIVCNSDSLQDYTINESTIQEITETE